MKVKFSEYVAPLMGGFFLFSFKCVIIFRKMYNLLSYTALSGIRNIVTEEKPIPLQLY